MSDKIRGRPVDTQGSTPLCTCTLYLFGVSCWCAGISACDINSLDDKWWRRGESNPRPRTFNQGVYRFRSTFNVASGLSVNQGRPEAEPVPGYRDEADRGEDLDTGLMGVVASIGRIRRQPVEAPAVLCSQSVVVVVVNYLLCRFLRGQRLLDLQPRSQPSPSKPCRPHVNERKNTISHRPVKSRGKGPMLNIFL